MLKNDINLNLYKTFYDVARYGNISKAAELTYSTQPAISKAIKKLERELETELFYRKASGVELTPKGRELLFYVEKSFGNLLTAERILLETDTLNRGKVSIGLPTNLLSYIYQSIIAFHEKYPNIEITIVNGGTTYLLEQLELHKIDFIIDTSPIFTLNNNLKIETLCNSDYCFVVATDKKFSNINKLKDLEKYQLILPVPGTTNRKNLDELFVKNNILINNIINIHSSEIIRQFVIDKMGIGYLLYDFIKDDINKDKLQIINIKEKLPTAEIVLIYDERFLTTAPKKFIDNYIK